MSELLSFLVANQAQSQGDQHEQAIKVLQSQVALLAQAIQQLHRNEILIGILLLAVMAAWEFRWWAAKRAAGEKRPFFARSEK